MIRQNVNYYGTYVFKPFKTEVKRVAMLGAPNWMYLFKVCVIGKKYTLTNTTIASTVASDYCR